MLENQRKLHQKSAIMFWPIICADNRMQVKLVGCKYNKHDNNKNDNEFFSAFIYVNATNFAILKTKT